MKMSAKLKTGIAVLLMCLAVANTSVAEPTVYRANGEGTIRVMTGSGSPNMKNANDYVSYVFTKNIHSDNTAVYTWTLAYPYALLGDTIKISVDNGPVFICDKQPLTQEVLAQYPPVARYATWQSYLIPPNVVEAMNRYQKTISVTMLLGNQEYTDKNVGFKKDLKNLAAANWENSLK